MGFAPEVAMVKAISEQMSARQPYVSSIPLGAQGFTTGAIFCSDGRFADQVDDFLHNGLGLPGYDRLAVAGGPACFAGHFLAYREEEGAVSHLKFLSRLHGLTRLILISHEGCGFYRDFLRVREFDLIQKQCEDLVRAARRVREAAVRLEIEAHFARIVDGTVQFERIAVG
jgi:hypothetical protein